MNKKSDVSAPLTSFDWNEKSPNVIGTASVDTTCTIWDVEKRQMMTQLIAHDREVLDIAWSHRHEVFATAGSGEEEEGLWEDGREEDQEFLEKVFNIICFIPQTGRSACSTSVTWSIRQSSSRPARLTTRPPAPSSALLGITRYFFICAFANTFNLC